MSSGVYNEGNCKLCGNYTKNINFKDRGLCLSCSYKLDNWSKEDLIKELLKVKKDLGELKFLPYN